MFKHILLPTDGSALSDIAVDNGLKFAKETGAKVTGFYVLVERPAESFEDFAPVSVKAPAHDELSKQEAQKYLAIIANKAKASGVPCATLSMSHTSPHQAIVKAATDNGCDIIVMASHGRKGVTGELVGSETARVITSCKIPVLVYR
jgi:nucleotide-binding universal stress UspA family protein